MSPQDVADACEEIRYPGPGNVIANMESGRRTSLPLAEVMVLAEALHTNPISLIIPVGRIADYQALPLRPPVSAWDALSWFTGEDGLNSEWSLRLYRMHHAALSSAQEAAMNIGYYRHQGSTAPNPERRAKLPPHDDGTRRALNRAGYDTLKAALDHVRALLNIPDADDPEGIALITEMLEEVADDKSPLPDVEETRRRLNSGQELIGRLPVAE